MTVRVSFTEELEKAEAELLIQGRLVDRSLERVLGALERRDANLAQQVIEDDDDIDRVYLDTQGRILDLLALQAPVAGDLRLVSAILHSNVHLERMGDLCVNVAKFVNNQMPCPTDSSMMQRLLEMGDRASTMLGIALSAFSQRDTALAESLPGEDDHLDRLNRGMLDDLKRYVDDDISFEWATNLILVARYLERFGDHCVDIGEQIAFLVTGVFREFTDASHPEVEQEGETPV